jgi:hypothetical protein
VETMIVTRDYVARMLMPNIHSVRVADLSTVSGVPSMMTSVDSGVAGLLLRPHCSQLL